jgi:hypothetical protein
MGFLLLRPQWIVEFHSCYWNWTNDAVYKTNDQVFDVIVQLEDYSMNSVTEELKLSHGCR